MITLCYWMAALIFVSAVGWFVGKENIDYLIEFLLGVAFTVLVYVATM